MFRKRRLMLELMEDRRLLAIVGPVDPANSPAWQAVIVELKENMDSSAAAAQELLHASSGRLDQTYEYAMRGFAARLPKDAVESLRYHPRVSHIEIDLPVQAFAQTVPTGVKRIEADALGLTAPINGIEEFIDVDIAIIDSGIDRTHPDLNVAGGVNFAGGGVSNFNDGFGHGSHVAGIAAARDNGIGVVGVAPGARLWGVRVLGNTGTGSLSNVIKGVDWVTQNAATIEIANMSLGALGVSTIYHNAIKNSVAAGVVYVAAAGNNYRDILGGDPATASPLDSISDTLPAAYPEVATISAFADSDGQPGGSGPAVGGYTDDTFADFSNFSNSGANGVSWYATNNHVNNPQGLGIDLVLPGVGIYSTYKGGGYTFMSGTSMAAPHAAGLVARYIVENGRATNATEVYAIRQALIDQGKAWRDPQFGLQFTTPGNSDSPDNFEENLGWAGPAGPVNLPPIAVNDEGYVVAEDSELSIAAVAGLLINDSDPEGLPLTAQLVSSTASGTLTLATDGSFTYLPNANFNGVDSFTYMANDGTKNSNLATVVITVQPVNDAPQATDQSVSLFQDNAQTITLSASDIDGDVLTYTIIVLPTQGTLSGSGAQWIYTPSTNYVGADSFTFQANDGQLDSQPGTVTIAVLPTLTEVVLFADSFENGPSSNNNNWNGRWTEDAQNDFFRSSQRATDGNLSAEVDGRASDATLTMSTAVDVMGYATAQLTFDWLIESGFDAGEYLALDVSTNGGSSWIQDVRRLNGNISTENVWHSETVDLTPYKSADLQVRFRSKVSASDEDANIDNVRIVGSISSVSSAAATDAVFAVQDDLLDEFSASL